MHIQLIRSATLRMDYAQHSFVIDPYLAAKHTMPSYTGASPNPLVELPCAPEAVLAGVEMAVVSHLHSDHFDPTARRLLSKALPLLCQPEDAPELERHGFLNVLPVVTSLDWQGIRMTRTTGQHGTGAVLSEMGTVSGFVFEAPQEPTVYWAGDTVWCEAVATVIEQWQPDIIITHSGGAVWGERVPIIMDAAQTVAVCHAAPESVVIATHMEALDHTTVTRTALRAYAVAHGVRSEQLLIPADGETLAF